MSVVSSYSVYFSFGVQTLCFVGLNEEMSFKGAGILSSWIIKGPKNFSLIRVIVNERKFQRGFL